ncbi:hypothetical protein BLOT_013075 [Blomia tropicalis]|nr:hypothetical protein BLOT_013075 [Blomia tropicalis]
MNVDISNLKWQTSSSSSMIKLITNKWELSSDKQKLREKNQTTIIPNLQIMFMPSNLQYKLQFKITSNILTVSSFSNYVSYIEN